MCQPRAKGCYTPSRQRIKNNAYECFRVSQELCSVAMFVPALPDAAQSMPTPFSEPARSGTECLTVKVSPVLLQ